MYMLYNADTILPLLHIKVLFKSLYNLVLKTVNNLSTGFTNKYTVNMLDKHIN